ncbi:MAG: type III-B CRISPR module RAMP protein Cmr4 [Gammaproteobacteria bacterium]
MKIFKERFAILPDNSFDFLCKMGTEINARIRIDDEKKTVAKGALWYEESLPAESILAGLVWCARVFSDDRTITQGKLLQTYCTGERSLQIGGKATIGKGRVRCLFNGDQSAPDTGKEQGNGNP